MPPITNDDQAQALHVLAVTDAAVALAAAVARGGAPDTYQGELRALLSEVARLSLFQRKSAHRLVPYHDAPRIAEAVNELRRERVLSGEDHDAMTAAPENVASLFSTDGLEETPRSSSAESQKGDQR